MRRLVLALPVAAAAATVLLSLTAAAGSPAAPPDDTTQDDTTQDDSGPQDLGRTLYDTHCTSCHGVDGNGIEDRGPPLTAEGEAAVDFVLRTGRMPMAEPDMQAESGPVQFTEDEILALVEYAGAFGDGPGIPDVDLTDADVANGGEIFRLNCAACHVASLAGASIGGGRDAPSLMDATPTEIAEATLIGPGAMPVFGSFSDQDRNDLAAYIVQLQDRNRDEEWRDFGGVGPVGEGLGAWLLALLPLVALTRWIGSPHQGRDVGANPPVDEHGDVVSS